MAHGSCDTVGERCCTVMTGDYSLQIEETLVELKSALPKRISENTKVVNPFKPKIHIIAYSRDD
jgi:hypothetical protein